RRRSSQRRGRSPTTKLHNIVTRNIHIPVNTRNLNTIRPWPKMRISQRCHPSRRKRMNNLPSFALHDEPIRCVIQGPGSHQIINQVIPSHLRIRTTQKLRHLSAAHPCTLLTISLKKLDTKLGNISGTEINHRTQMRLSSPQILNRHILRITRGTHVMLRIINLTSHKGGLQGRWLGEPLQRSNQSAKSFRKPRHASLPPPSAISCRARSRWLIILTHRLVPISVPLAVSRHSDFATVLQHLQTPQGHRHSTQRSNINRRFSAVPHPHLTQILLHSIIKRQTQRFLLTEPNRPVHHTVRKL